MFITALIICLRRGKFWIFRVQGGKSSIPYIVANGSTCWIIPAVLFYASKSSLVPHLSIREGSCDLHLHIYLFFIFFSRSSSVAFQAYIWLNIEISSGEVVNIIGFAKILIWISTLICVSFTPIFLSVAVTSSTKNFPFLIFRFHLILLVGLHYGL